MSSVTADVTPAKTAGEWFEDMPLTKTYIAAGLTIFVTFAIEAWEMMIIIFSAGMIGAEFNLDTKTIGVLISAIFFGMILGALIWGQLASSIGRRKCLIASIALYAIFPIISAMATSCEMLWWTRGSLRGLSCQGR